MGKCRYHSDIDTPYQCQKYGEYLCPKCLRCQDPELYCKHRTACPIWFMEKVRDLDGVQPDRKPASG